MDREFNSAHLRILEPAKKLDLGHRWISFFLGFSFWRNDDIFISKLTSNGNYEWAVSMVGADFDVGMSWIRLFILVNLGVLFRMGYLRDWRLDW